MAADEKSLIDLASQVADGQPLDWSDLESRASTDTDRAVIHQLKVLAGVIEVHRGIEETDTDVRHPPVDEDLSHTRWGLLDIRERVGAGSFGSVYRAWDPRLDREVALKLLRLPPSGDEASTAFVTEGMLLARVRHPHVVTVFGADAIDRRVGIWMEFIHGRTLEDVLRNDGRLGAREAALIGEQLCGALAAVHREGLVHGDVKAQNVMREDGGRIVLMDFGAGRERIPSVNRGTVTGTPLYMAPEVLAGGDVTERSDLYSLGVLLFRLSTGEYPVFGETMAAVRLAHARSQRRRLRDLRPDLPSGFVKVVETALEADPGARHASAGLMENALSSAFQRESTPAIRRHALAAVLLLVVAAVMWASRDRDGLGLPPVQGTIAVLPFANRTGDDGQAYFASGVTDLLVARLAAIRTLRVIPPSSTGGLSNDPQRLPKVATLLHAAHLVEGAVERSGDRMRISVRVIQASNGAAVWGQTYERPVGDLFVVEGEVATALANAILAHVDTAAHGSSRYTPSAQALDAYLRGRYLLYQFNKSLVPEARRELELAVSLDSQFALAYASLSRVYLLAEAYGLLAPGEAASLASRAAEQAVALSPDLSEAHVALAEVRFKSDRDWRGAEVEYREALKLSPHASTVRSPYSRFLSADGRPDDALTHALAGVEADPLAPEMIASLGITYYYLRQFDDAIREFSRSVAVNGSYGPGYFGRARAEAENGAFENAIADVRQALKLSGDDSSYVAELARVQAAAGWRNAAEQELGGLLDLSRKPGQIVASQDLAYVYAALGDRERALDLLTDALKANFTRVLFLRVDPRVDVLRQEPRFQDLLRELGTRR
jgi:serine/threonine-protein kinase